jgi:hypothetical protein
LAEPGVLRLAPADIDRLGLQAGVPAVVDCNGRSVELPFEVEPRLVPSTAWLPLRLPGIDVRELLSAGRSVTSISIRPMGGA